MNFNRLHYLEKVQSLQFTKSLKRLILIQSIICAAFINLNASSGIFPDEKKPGDDKKAKAKREDTTKFAIQETLPEEEDEESPDTLQITFPSHDLYSSWDTIAA